MKRGSLLALLATIAGFLWPTPHARADDRPRRPVTDPFRPLVAAPGAFGVFLSVLAPGQGTSTTTADAVRFLGAGQLPPHTDDQLRMYEALVRDGLVSRRTLHDFFKRAALGTPVDGAVEEPRDGVRIIRDGFGVPHVFGRSRTVAMWGVGYATAQDRMFLIDVLRHIGAGRLSELVGPSPVAIALDRDMYLYAGYSERERMRQITRLRRSGPLGAEIVGDLRWFVAGVNAWIASIGDHPNRMPAEYPALQIRPARWKVTDVLSVATLFGAEFGTGGGGELANANFLSRAEGRFGARRGKELWRDLRSQEHPETPVTIARRFPYMRTLQSDPHAVAMPNIGSVELYDPLVDHLGPDAPFGGPVSRAVALGGVVPRLHRDLVRAGLAVPQAMSNFVAVTAQRSATGHPIAVMGAQTGYWTPEILMEIHLRAPGIDARGAMFPGMPYVFIGRGRDFAWGATSGRGDIVDIRAERLCESAGGEPTLRSDHYVFNATCRPMMRRTDAWVATPTGGGPGTPQRIHARVLRTVHGPVIARGMVGSRPVAFVAQRSTFMSELDSATGLALFNSMRMTGPRVFRRAAHRVAWSFNWLYVDDSRLAYFHSGKYPLRAAGVNPNFPSWGTGRWEWKGFLPFARHPQAVDPARGWIASWNNKPATGWRAADDNWSWGSTQRVDLLTERLERKRNRKLTIGDVVKITADAATVDLRGRDVLPSILRLVGPQDSIRRYVRILEEWVRDGAHRRGSDGGGRYDDPQAVALIDAWWPRLIQSMFRHQLRGLYRFIPLPFDDPGRTAGLGSSFQRGYYGIVRSAIRSTRRDAVVPHRRVRCANGDERTCRRAVAESLRAAVRVLGEDPAAWNPSPSRDAIRFTPIGLITMPEIPWQNRPTFQQVVSVFRHRPRGEDGTRT